MFRREGCLYDITDNPVLGKLSKGIALWLKDLFLKQASRGPLRKAAISGQYETVKMLLDNGEDVDQRDQVLVIFSLCNFIV